MKKIILIYAVIFFSGLSYVFADGAGTTSGLTLSEPLSARIAGLANAGSALSGTADLLKYNPAGIAVLKGQETSVLYRRGLDEDNYAAAVYAKECPFGSLGAMIQYYDTGKIELYDTNGNAVQETGQRDIVIGVGGAREISGISVGVNLKFITSEVFGENAAAFAADLGVQYGKLMNGLNLGLAVRNLGTEMKYKDEGDPLPMNVAIGASYTKNINDENDILAAVDLPYYTNEQELLALLGVEYMYKKLISARAGYKLNLSESDAESESLSIGIGVNWDRYSLDYTVGLASDLSTPHNISIKAKF